MKVIYMNYRKLTPEEINSKLVTEFSIEKILLDLYFLWLKEKEKMM